MTATPNRPVLGPHHTITTLERLREQLQWAVRIELSTIPPYLFAMYSLRDNAEQTYRLIRSVVFEEMLHMMLASNLLNAIGEPPKFAGELAPRYPTFMPHHAANGPYIQLQPFSTALVSTTFMAIERPAASRDVPAEGDHYETLGQFYKAIEEGLERLGPDIYRHDTGFQAKDTYFGLGGGHLIEVKDLASARRAIREIVLQGEGAEWPGPLDNVGEPFGGHEYYGQRADGTFGPIIGTPLEMSHYFKFQRLTSSDALAWPVAANPDTDALPDGWLRELSTLCDNGYALLLSSLELALGARPERGYFFGAAFPAMQFILTPLANLLVQTPLSSYGDPSLGPNLGPSFRSRTAPVGAMIERTQRLLAAGDAVSDERGPEYAYAYRTALEGILSTLRGVDGALAGASLGS